MSNLDIIDPGDNLADVPAFYTGTGATTLVPDVFPIGINGRPYMIDQESGQFSISYEPRVRDSVDQSNEPGENTISSEGLWRRGYSSWHFGAGQQYSDTESVPYRFHKSKGINPWTKGQISLLNTTKVAYTQASSTANVRIVATNNAVFVTDGTAVKYTTDPFASTPSWTTVSGLPSLEPRDIETDGQNVYLTYAGTSNAYGLWKINTSYTAAVLAHNQEFRIIGYAKGRLLVSDTTTGVTYDPNDNEASPDDTVKIANWTWVGFAGGQGAIYAAGYAGNKSVIYKITITDAGVLDKLVAALELPTGEVVSAIHGYLGFIILGTNKGVRFCSTDNQNNLIAGSLIPTTGSVLGFTAEDRFVWYTYSNYDGTSSGLGRLDLSVFSSSNTPAYATDLMYTSTGDVLSCCTFNSKRLFSVKGVGVVAEDSSLLVAQGTMEVGTFRWGIPDPKFVAKTEIRTEPLAGSVEMQTSVDGSAYSSSGLHSSATATSYVFPGNQNKAGEAKFKMILNANSGNTTGPVVTRFSAQAYAAPARSQVFILPLLLHSEITVWDTTYYFDVSAERSELRSIIDNPRTIILQIGGETHSVIVESMDWRPVDAWQRKWEWDGTAIITLRSVQE